MPAAYLSGMRCLESGGTGISLRALIVRYKAASAATAAFVLVVVLVTAATVVASSSAAALSDSSTCSEWAAAGQAQQSAYAHRYINEQRAQVIEAPSAVSVESALQSACNQAAYLGEADDLSVVAAIKHDY